MKWIRERFAGCKLTEKVWIIDEAPFYTNRNVRRQGRECESFQGVDSLLVHIEGGRTSGSASEPAIMLNCKR